MSAQLGPWLPTGGAEKYPDVVVQLSGKDGNAFAVLGEVLRALRRAGVDEDTRDQFQREATSGDYDHLLRTCMAWVQVQ